MLSTPPIRGLRKVDDLSIHNHFLGVSARAVGTQLQSHPQNCVELIGLLLTKVKVLQSADSTKSPVFLASSWQQESNLKP